jgi:hypothetical protein
MKGGSVQKNKKLRDNIYNCKATVQYWIYPNKLALKRSI